jgi:uncharacterized protein (TIGR02453 family)
MRNAQYFTPELFAVLADLKRNNNRRWFEAHKATYESTVKEASIRFILEIGPHLHALSEHISVNPRPVGGSLFRIYRDVRFSKDKSSYKTHVGIHFPVRANFGKNAPHAAGFYLHLEPGGSFGGGGIWHPEPENLMKIRHAIAEHPKEWRKICTAMEIEGDRLKRPPAGFDPDHPCIEDLKLKDFFASTSFTQAQVTGKHFLEEYVESCKRISPLVAFLNNALKLPW